jgi:hypothetical protein
MSYRPLPLMHLPAGPLCRLQPGSLVTLLTSYLLSLRFNAPAAALMLVASLHSTLQQCTADCRGGGQMQAAGIYAGGWAWGRRPLGTTVGQLACRVSCVVQAPLHRCSLWRVT